MHLTISGARSLLSVLDLVTAHTVVEGFELLPLWSLVQFLVVIDGVSVFAVLRSNNMQV